MVCVWGKQPLALAQIEHFSKNKRVRHYDYIDRSAFILHFLLYVLSYSLSCFPLLSLSLSLVLPLSLTSTHTHTHTLTHTHAHSHTLFLQILFVE
jgi:hypothetical protein